MLLPNTLIISTLGLLAATSIAASPSPHGRSAALVSKSQRRSRHHQKRQPQDADAPDSSSDSRVIFRGTAGLRNATISRPEDSSSSSSLSKRDSYSGTATYFAIGLGACGQWSYEPQYIVAMNSGQFNALGTSYPSPQCFKYVTIQGPAGNTAVAQVMDECPTCGGWGDLDMSEALFKNFATLDAGVAPITWWFNDGTGGGSSSSSQWQAPSSTSTSTSVWQAPSTSSTPQWTPTTSSSQWVAPTTSSSPAWTPSSSSSQWVAPTTSSSSAWVAPSSSSSSSSSAWSSSVTTSASTSSTSSSAVSSSTSASTSLAINVPQQSAVVQQTSSSSSSTSSNGLNEQQSASNLVMLSGLTAQYGSLVVNAAQQVIGA